MQIACLATFLALVALAGGRLEDKYDLRELPHDLIPVRSFVGLWTLLTVKGTHSMVPPPDLIDFGINPIPKFGARAINITHTYFRGKNIARTDYGYMPVKNKTRSDPRVHTAYLTSSSEGYSMMEQGLVEGSTIKYHLKQYLRRSFSVGGTDRELQIDALERSFTLNGRRLEMSVQAMTNFGNDDYTATYSKLL